MDLRHLLFTLALVCANDSLSSSDGKFYGNLSVPLYVYSFIRSIFILYASGVLKGP